MIKNAHHATPRSLSRAQPGLDALPAGLRSGDVTGAENRVLHISVRHAVSGGHEWEM